jgi:hypothetical protein
MPNKLISIDFKEFARILIREKGIHAGLWSIHVRFGITAANAHMKAAEDVAEPQLFPTALVPIIEIGLQEVDEPNDLTVDASVVNPSKKKPVKKVV